MNQMNPLKNWKSTNFTTVERCLINVPVNNHGIRQSSLANSGTHQIRINSAYFNSESVGKGLIGSGFQPINLLIVNQSTQRKHSYFESSTPKK